jgi:hypothetical protein
LCRSSLLFGAVLQHQHRSVNTALSTPQYCLRIEQINNAITTHLLVPRHNHTNTLVSICSRQDNQKLSLCFFQIVKEQGIASDKYIKQNALNKTLKINA